MTSRFFSLNIKLYYLRDTTCFLPELLILSVSEDKRLKQGKLDFTGARDAVTRTLHKLLKDGFFVLP